MAPLVSPSHFVLTQMIDFLGRALLYAEQSGLFE